MGCESYNFYNFQFNNFKLFKRPYKVIMESWGVGLLHIMYLHIWHLYVSCNLNKAKHRLSETYEGRGQHLVGGSEWQLNWYKCFFIFNIFMYHVWASEHRRPMRGKATGNCSMGKWATRRVTDFTSNFRGTGDHPPSVSRPTRWSGWISCWISVVLVITNHNPDTKETTHLVLPN